MISKTFFCRHFYSTAVRFGSSSALLVLTILQPPLAQAATNCAPQPSGLVGWWSAEGDASDRTGMNPGTIRGGVTFEAGEVGQAFSIHAWTNTVMIPASASLDVGAGPGLTIEAWIKRSSDSQVSCNGEPTG